MACILSEPCLKQIITSVFSLSDQKVTGVRFIVSPVVSEYGVPTGNHTIEVELTTEGPDGEEHPGSDQER